MNTCSGTTRSGDACQNRVVEPGGLCGRCKGPVGGSAGTGRVNDLDVGDAWFEFGTDPDPSMLPQVEWAYDEYDEHIQAVANGPGPWNDYNWVAPPSLTSQVKEHDRARFSHTLAELWHQRWLEDIKAGADNFADEYNRIADEMVKDRGREPFPDEVVAQIGALRELTRRQPGIDGTLGDRIAGRIRNGRAVAESDRRLKEAVGDGVSVEVANLPDGQTRVERLVVMKGQYVSGAKFFETFDDARVVVEDGEMVGYIEKGHRNVVKAGGVAYVKV